MQFEKSFVDLKVIITKLNWNVEPVASLNDFFGCSERTLQVLEREDYPHYDRYDVIAFDELDKIIQYDTRELIDGDNIVQTMHGLGFLWTFHPHWVEVNNILELWDDDDKLRELCRKTIEYCDKHEDGKVSVNRIRQNSKVYLAKQSVSNFRPTRQNTYTTLMEIKV